MGCGGFTTAGNLESRTNFLKARLFSNVSQLTCEGLYLCRRLHHVSSVVPSDPRSMNLLCFQDSHNCNS